MGIFIKDPATDEAVRTLAKLRGTSLTDAIRQAVNTAIEAEKAAGAKPTDEEFLKGIREIQARFARYPETGLKADKAFYDWLSGEEDVP